MFLSPLAEVPSIGRNNVYIATFFLYVIFQIPIIFANDFPTILAFRFLTGFVGSPALATVGASLADVFHPIKFPYVIGLWCVGATCGPVLVC
jgi:MFS transporter, DHA1 family, multidrug resistance protein